MKKPIPYLLVAICIVFVTNSYAQHRRYAIKNGVGIFGGITQFNINTDNFDTKASTGYIGGLTATVDIPHKWYNVSYNIQLSENNIDINAEDSSTSNKEYVDYKMLTAQVALLFHIKLISNIVTFDVGPMLQYNGELELKDDSKEGLFISGYDNLFTEDISDISKFNANGVVGITTGYGNFKLRAQYIYGFTNILEKLNDKELSSSTPQKFKGNQSLLAFTAIITF
ncbi:MAG: outer membrane beta-barrel protein [Winogradskyella sp.]|uniref:hypothetical protein n=1 Tax=Winogradskyella sp. TaxID=1883156 RepID=UPI0017957DF8|nr:outer membrane beta-barrel protein [Winogradskyella sp.]